MSKSKKNTIVIMICSFIIPIAVFCALYYFRDIYIKGPKTLLAYDNDQLFAPFLNSLRYVADGTQSLFYSFSGGLGHNYLGNYFTNLANPVNWLICLWPTSKMTDGLFVLTAVRFGLCGISMATFLLFGNVAKKGLKPFYVVLISITYALIQYNFIYSMCFFLIDGVAFLPVICLGIEHLVQGKKPYIYVISFTLLLYFTYYCAFIVTIAGGLFFIICLSEYCKNFKDVVKSTGKYVVASLISGILASPVLWVVFDAVMKGDRKSEPSAEFFLMSFKEILSRMFFAQYDSILSEGLPCLQTTLAAILLTISFFFIPKIKFSKKAISLFVLIFVLAGVELRPLNLLWHGGKWPHSFEFRQAFVWCFFVLYFSAEALVYLNECSFTKTKICKYIYLFFILLSFMEIPANAYVTVEGIDIENKYKDRDFYVSADIKQQFFQDNIQSNGFYRTRKYDNSICNEGTLFGMKSMPYFSSCYNAKDVLFLKSLGITANQVAVDNCGYTPVLDSLFSVRYLLYEADKPTGEDTSSGESSEMLICEDYSPYKIAGYEQIAKKNGMIIYENTMASPVGMMTKGLISDLNFSDNAIYNQNELVKLLSNEDYDVFRKIDTQYASSPLEFTMPCDGYVFVDWNLYYKDKESGEYYKTDIESLSAENVDLLAFAPLELWVNAEKKFTAFSTTNVPHTLAPGFFENGEKVELEFSNNRICADDISVYYLDEAEYVNAMRTIQSRGLQVTGCNKSRIEGTFIAEADDYMIFSIPYDAKWKIYVDGKRVKQIEGEPLITIKCDEGQHNLKMYYMFDL